MLMGMVFGSRGDVRRGGVEGDMRKGKQISDGGGSGDGSHGDMVV